MLRKSYYSTDLLEQPYMVKNLKRAGPLTASATNSVLSTTFNAVAERVMDYFTKQNATISEHCNALIPLLDDLCDDDYAVELSIPGIIGKLTYYKVESEHLSLIAEYFEDLAEAFTFSVPNGSYSGEDLKYKPAVMRKWDTTITIQYPRTCKAYGVNDFSDPILTNGRINEYPWFIYNSELGIGFIAKSVASSSIDGSSYVVPTTELIGKFASEATLNEAYSTVSTEINTAYSEGRAVNIVAAIQSILSKTGEIKKSPIQEQLSELQDALLLDSSPLGAMKTVDSLMNKSSYQNQGSFLTLTDNSTYISQSMVPILFSGIVSSLSDVVSIVGIAISGIFGAVMAVAGQAVKLISTAFSTVDAALTKVRFQQNQGGNNLFVVGYAQQARNSVPSDWVGQLLQDTPAWSTDCLAFKIFGFKDANDSTAPFKSEIHIKDGCLSGKALCELLHWNKSSTPGYFLPMTRAEVFMAMEEDYSNAIAPSEIYPALDDLDKYERGAMIISAAYLLVAAMAGTVNGQQSFINFDATTTNTAKYTLGLLLQILSAHNYDPYVLGSDEDFAAWDNITGASHWGCWWIFNAIMHMPNDAPGEDWFPNISHGDSGYQLYRYNEFISEVTRFSANRISMPVTYSVYYTPWYNIIPPKFSASSFRLAIALTLTTVAITSIAVIAAKIVVGCKLRRYNAIQNRKIEKAWENLGSNPTPEQVKSYSKMVRKHNLIARFTGGTIYDRTNFWGGDDSSSDASLSSSTIIYKAITGHFPGEK